MVGEGKVKISWGVGKESRESLLPVNKEGKMKNMGTKLISKFYYGQ